MKHLHHSISLASAALLLGALLMPAPALAAGQTERDQAGARHKQEVAVCTSGQSNQDRATCLKEAGAAYAEALRGGQGSSAVAPGNASKRCEALKGDENTACLARMQGQGTTSGSVAAGGISRELVTVTPAPAAPAAK